MGRYFIILMWIVLIGIFVLWILDRISLANAYKTIIQQSSVIGDQMEEIDDLKKQLPVNTTPNATPIVPPTETTAP